VDDTLLTVHINPYFLRLNFSHPLLEDDDSSARYDAISGYLTITLTKEIKGQAFQDLDLLAKLLAPRLHSARSSKIEVIERESSLQDDTDDLVEKTEMLSLNQSEILEGVCTQLHSSNTLTLHTAAENDWQLPQSLPGPLPTLHLSTERPYGFLDSYSGYLRHVTHTENEINELGADAETCPVEERRKRRLEHEDAKWDEEHYM